MKTKFSPVKLADRYILFKNSWISWIIFITSLVITIFIWNIVRNDIIEKAAISFNDDVDEVKIAIARRMESYEQVLKGGAALFKVDDNITRADFHGYVEDLQIEKKFPGIQGVGFAEVIHPDELNQHIQEIRAEGFPNYKVWPEGKRDLYTSIIYLEPFSGRNLRAFGYDMYSEPNRHHAMSMATDLGEAFASAKVYLVQETNTDIQKGFLIYYPVYKPGMDISTPEARRKAIFGFVYSPFRMNDLMRGILGSQRPSVSIEIFDGDAADSASLMYSSNNKNPRKPLFSSVSQINTDNRPWLVRFATTKELEAEVDNEKPWIVLVSGFLISILLFFSSYTFEKAKTVYKNIEEVMGAAGEGIYGLDINGECIFVNDAALDMIGYKKEEIIGKSIHDIIHYKKEDGRPCPTSECPVFSSMKTTKKISADDEVFWRKDGSMFHVQLTANPIYDKNIIKGTVVAFSDITERKKYESQIKASLKEKEVLLKEIHHRVKNNMQVISSLLNLQYQYLQNHEPETVNAFQESQDRIRSMALIHEKLYQTNDLTNINFGDYVRDLVARLYTTYKSTTGTVAIMVDTPAMDLNMDTSISLGLVINELVSNAFKHAFPGRQDNRLNVSVKKDTTCYELAVSDNGRGFPEDIDFKNTESLGLQLITTLTTQIDGTITLDRNNGTTFTIKFPAEK